MKLHYYPETDSLYIDLNCWPSADSREITDGLVIDFDADGNIVGIDIDHASQKLDLKFPGSHRVARFNHQARFFRP